MIDKAVLAAAGLGTRLLPLTKELPKEMLPIFVNNGGGRLTLKPMLQAVYEQLYSTGFRHFCFVVGREKRAIEDHFTPDMDYLNQLIARNKNDQFLAVKAFYEIIRDSTIVWMNQPEPKGFGDAVLRSESFVGSDMFLCHAGDTYIGSRENRHLAVLSELSAEERCAASFVAQRVDDPKGFGIVEGDTLGEGLVKVKRVVEKPEKPMSNIAIMPMYIFKPIVFKALREIEMGYGGEIQLTDAIQRLIDWKYDVYAHILDPDDIRLDIGTPETWWEALSASHSYLKSGH